MRLAGGLWRAGEPLFHQPAPEPLADDPARRRDGGVLFVGLAVGGPLFAGDAPRGHVGDLARLDGLDGRGGGFAPAGFDQKIVGAGSKPVQMEDFIDSKHTEDCKYFDCLI